MNTFLSQSENSPNYKEIVEELINETKFYRKIKEEEKLKKLENQIYEGYLPTEGKKTREAYLLEKNFLIKWKKYVNYRFLKNSHFLNYDINNFKFSHHPGPISNNILLVSFYEFYNDRDESNPENIVIKNDVKRKEDYEIISEKLWNFFNLKYGGGPIIKRFFSNDIIGIPSINLGSLLDLDIHKMVLFS